MPKDAEIVLDRRSHSFDPIIPPQKPSGNSLFSRLASRFSRRSRSVPFRATEEGENFAKAILIALGLSIPLWAVIVGAIYLIMC